MKTPKTLVFIYQKKKHTNKKEQIIPKTELILLNVKKMSLKPFDVDRVSFRDCVSVLQFD